MSDPTRPFAYTPCSEDSEQGWKAISYRELATAIDHFAYWLRARAERPSLSDYPTLAYIGPSDIRYIIVMFGCIKAGWKAFFPSPRNSLEGQLSLLEKTNCHVFYFADAYRSVVEPLLPYRQMEAVEAPDVSTWLSSNSAPFPYDRTLEQSRWDPLVVLHTSGSTGIPKPIIVHQGSIMVGDALMDSPELNGAPTFWKHLVTNTSRLFVPMPLFHAAGIACTLLVAVYGGVPVVFSIPGRPLNADSVAQCLHGSSADAAILPPSIIEDMALSAEGIEALARLKIVLFGGGEYASGTSTVCWLMQCSPPGNLARASGDLLVSRGVLLSNVISSTE